MVEVGEQEVVLDHREISGFMGAMVMPFDVTDPEMLVGLKPGDQVIGRLRVHDTTTEIERLRVVGHGPAPVADGPPELAVGERLPATEVVFEDGSSGRIGEGQGRAATVTFLYTRCPDPRFCPSTIARLQGLQRDEPGHLLIAVSLDPDRDTLPVLRAYASEVGADPAVWRFARVEPAVLRDLAMRAGMAVSRSNQGEIVHGIRWWELDADGRLVARHEGNDW